MRLETFLIASTLITIVSVVAILAWGIIANRGDEL